MSNSKYKMLTNVLDSLCLEAPENMKRYTDLINVEDKNKARSLAYIHLFLKAYFNLSQFDIRENFIVDGTNDGGIDAYYPDKEHKVIYFIQSKFRTNENNFESKTISAEELAKMDIDRILEGEKKSAEGVKYNGKILRMQDNINKLDGLPRYNYKVIILSNVNLGKNNEVILERLVGKYENEIINYQKAYDNLLFPLLKGISHVANEITVNLSLDGKNTATLDYEVNAEGIESSVQLFFVPTEEIAKVMSVYKNSILQYNPRSFLGADKLSINNQIKDSIIKKKSNEFSLFNNGITILSDETFFNRQTGKSGQAKLQLKNPQIINGGQTANTLALIYEDHEIDNSVFNGKEVLVKIITFIGDSETKESEGNLLEKEKRELIENLSRTTNLQSIVKDSDRRSNDDIQVTIQNIIFDKFGYCYNRKEGEFLDSINKGYIDWDKVIARDILIRVANSLEGKVSLARRSGEKTLFKASNFYSVLNDKTDIKKLMYGYFVYRYLFSFEKKTNNAQERYRMDEFGSALRYGKYAVVNAVGKFYNPEISDNNLEDYAKEITNQVLSQWKNFERSLVLKNHNDKYFTKNTGQTDTVAYNFDGYYKGSTLDEDIRTYEFISDYKDE